MPGKITYLQVLFNEDVEVYGSVVYPAGSMTCLSEATIRSLRKSSITIIGPGTVYGALPPWTTGPSGAGTIAQMVASPLSSVLGATWSTPNGLMFTVALSPIDNTTKYWKPRGGYQLLYSRGRSIASPLSTLQAVSGQFAIPGGAPTIPPGLLLAGVSSLHVRAHLYRLGITTTGVVNLRIGTAATTADPLVASLTMAATNGASQLLEGHADYHSSTVFSTVGAATPNAAASASLGNADRTTNVNTAATQTVSLDLASASAADAFSIVGLMVELRG